MMRVTNRMIRKLLPKLTSIEKEIAEEKGSFRLFGIFLRERQPNRAWDLVISADWLDISTLEAERIFVNRDSISTGTRGISHVCDGTAS